MTFIVQILQCHNIIIEILASLDEQFFFTFCIRIMINWIEILGLVSRVEKKIPFSFLCQ